jgi:internalin A
LQELRIENNSVSDISPLSGLVNLTYLMLRGNGISDISALAGMTNLASLYLYGNTISDISSLAGLTKLTYLELMHNSITDISALVTNAAAGGLGSGDMVSLQDNTLSAQGLLDVGTLRTTYSVTVSYP